MLAGRSRLTHLIVIAIVLAVVTITVSSGHFGIGHNSPSTPPAVVVPLGTPTDRDQQVIANAHTLDVDGHEEDALTTLHSLLKSPDPAAAAESLLATAKIQIELDEISAAIKTLTTLRTEYPQSPQADDAQLILGQARASQGDDLDAIRELTPYAKRHEGIAPYVNLLIAGYLEDTGKWKDALALAKSVASLP
ncbi:MAG TPA: tetratricopeptide repeat protein, partial [Nitrolancea sp.]|nr:tetratricopeptide repeat protein [Nitrolancea sp.]